ncbi:hypothetical protein SD70_07215 [Gordoniibacillus kamchatkensis]|uniref:Uncharacterized protein n=1 Tax=Gordoniibacillus kamchatkensis TaxID=1590651 RepID=A0ABR5AK62_9BACL|nr:hypothetical protein SD70_07215 [Paenibacillus sp. VKM B-2647]
MKTRKIAPFAVLTKALLILSTMLLAPLAVIFGAIALIFSLTVYTSSAFCGLGVTTVAIFSEKSAGIVMLA